MKTAIWPVHKMHLSKPGDTNNNLTRHTCGRYSSRGNLEIASSIQPRASFEIVSHIAMFGIECWYA
jgi:hypothetical protein